MHIDNCIRNIEVNIKDKHIRNAYKEVVLLKGGYKPHTNLCRGINSEILSTEDDIKARWKTHFQELLTTAVGERTNPLDNTRVNQTATEGKLEEEPPSMLDIEIAIQSMSNNKSPGIDNIPAELYKNGDQQLIKYVD
jgi:hypothetical protein